MAKTKAKKRKISIDSLMISYFIVALTVMLSGVSVLLHLSKAKNAINESTYQAVFLTNGQVYFGKLDGLSHRSVALTDVYYIQQEVSQSGQTEPAEGEEVNPEAQLTVVRLGSELHEPENAMVINRDHILFWENLRTDSQVIEAIASVNRN